MKYSGPKIQVNKITFFIIGSALIMGVILIRLFQLQVLAHDYYQEVATREQYGFIELPAQRGEVIIKDLHSDEEFLLATNTTLNLIYADPAIIKNPAYLTEKLVPLLFDIEEERAKDNERIADLSKTLPADLTEEQRNEQLRALSDAELETKFRSDFTAKISEKQRTRILLGSNLEAGKLNTLKALNLSGIEILDDDVYAYPAQISDPTYTAEKIADSVEIPAKKLGTILKGENRYVVLKRKLDPAISDQITEMMSDDPDELFRGIGMTEEYFRFYPEGALASSIVGYVSGDNIGQYGIESTFNNELQGVAGKFQAKRDSIGRQITVGESILEQAEDGDDIVLTIDRSIQLKTEKILEAAVKKYRADSGQIIIMNPQTGAITAMANYPTFDPNNYGDAFKKVDAQFSPEDIAKLYPSNQEGILWFETNAITGDRYMVFEEKDENGNSHYYRYENFVGPEVYHNKVVAWPYEPGSVFKSVAMAIAIDDGDVTPNTTYNDAGPVGVDFNVYSGEYDFEIKNSTGYYGLVDMNTVLAKSLNTGMTFVAKTMGPALFYSYMEKFGFLDRTDIELDSEAVGKIKYFDDWTESELATAAFGQGMTVTMLQLANAYCALANGGILMQPYIVEEIRHDDGTVTKNEPHEIRRVISEDTSSKMTAMLVNSAENGEARQGQVEHHFIAGKTGTSQTYKWGRALSGSGTTIATFAGFGPIEDPQFVVLIKFDRPKTTEWGSSTAAPTFAELGEYLFNYYNIPPDKNISE